MHLTVACYVDKIMLMNPGADLIINSEIQQFDWLLMNFNQSECIISEQSNYSKLKFLCEIGSCWAFATASPWSRMKGKISIA